MGADLSKRLVPDELWEPAAPLLPSFAARPQGGGTAPCDERAVFTAVVYVLTRGYAWRHLPPTFSTSGALPTGSNPVDRGKKGSKLHMLSGAQGIPLAVAVSGANMRDNLALLSLIHI